MTYTLEAAASILKLYVIATVSLRSTSSVTLRSRSDHYDCHSGLRSTAGLAMANGNERTEAKH